MTTVRYITWAGMAYLTYEIGTAIYWEMKVVKHSSNLQNDEFMDEDQLEEKRAVEEYLKNHCSPGSLI